MNAKQEFNKLLVTTSDVNNETRIPNNNVIAKFFIVPVPRRYSTIEAIIVVIFPSRIAQSDFLKPDLTDAGIRFPLLYSSLIHSNIITFPSTAIPKLKIIPAILGSVS